MENFWLGFKAMFRIWSDPGYASRVRAIDAAVEPEMAKAPVPVAAPTPVPAPVPAAVPVPAAPAKAPVRSEALTLLSVLQREGRLVDFLKEPIGAYTDAQIGAAVRGVHEDCGKVLERLFAIAPLRSEGEGTAITIDGGFDPAEVRLVGSIPNQGPFKGTLQHAGWRATKAELPEWNGRGESRLVIAPCEVEIK